MEEGVNFDEDAAAEEFLGDEVRLKQILINLVKMALERSQNSKIKILADYDRV